MQLSDRYVSEQGLEPSRRELVCSLKEHAYKLEEEQEQQLPRLTPPNVALVIVAGIIGSWTVLLFIAWACVQVWEMLRRVG